MEKKNEIEKIHVNTRGVYPAASENEVMEIVHDNPKNAAYFVESFLDKDPKKSVNAELADKLFEKQSIKIGDNYVIRDTSKELEY